MRKFSPLAADHPLITDKKFCPVCLECFKAGDETTLTITWLASLEEAIKAQAGRSYISEATPVHWKCRGEEK